MPEILQLMKNIFTTINRFCLPATSLHHDHIHHLVGKHGNFIHKIYDNIKTNKYEFKYRALFKKNLTKLLIPGAMHHAIFCLYYSNMGLISVKLTYGISSKRLRAYPLGCLFDTKGNALCSHPLSLFIQIDAIK